MSSHTPGPWRNNNKIGYVYGPDCVVAVVGDFRDKNLLPFNRERWLADARLIAAAPDLLEALKAILPWHDSHPVEATDNPVINQCRAAIAKAVG